MKLTNNLLSKQRTYDQQQKRDNNLSFGGKFADSATKGLKACNTFPMIGVAVADLASTIVPRTIIDAQTNGFAAAETFRRESSGLVVNCLIPSFLVMGAAKLVKNNTMGKEFSKLKLSNLWLDEKNVNLMTSKWKTAEGATKEAKVKDFVTKTIGEFEALDGHEWHGLLGEKNKKSDEVINKITDLIINPPASHKESEKILGQVYNDTAEQLKATQHLKHVGTDKGFSSSLSELFRDTVDMGRRLNEGTIKLDNVDTFGKKLVKLINRKSLIGMAAVSVLAVSMQPLNRLITQKSSGQKGAPIYKDFADNQTKVEMTPKEKAQLKFEKLLAVGATIGTSLLSMKAGGAMPNTQMFQFKGMFPTVNQCRVISTETNASRMLAAEDRNELRETTIRDIVCFSSLYFLGDYVSKGVATALEKTKGVKLLNHTKELDKNASPLKKFTHWVTNTKVKAFEELPKTAHNMRSACELSSLGFSIAVLGIILPKALRLKTDKERAKQLEQAGESKTQIQKYYPLNMMGLSKETKQVFAKFVS